MTLLAIECPDDVLSVTTQTKDSLAELAREALFVRLYVVGEVSASWAAQTCHMSQQEFLDLVASYGIAAHDATIALEAERQRQTQLFQPRTALGKHLIEARAQLIATGTPLLTWEEIAEEVAERRGGAQGVRVISLQALHDHPND